MFRLLFLVYVVVEVAALWAVASWIGVGWAILLVMLGTAAGVIAFGTQTRRLVESLSRGRTGERASGARGPARQLAEGSLSATGVGLLLVPGLVTSVLGLLLLLPPTRRLLGPAVVALGMRRLSVVGVVGTRMPGMRRSGGARVVDGEVVDDPSRPGPPSAHDDLFPPVLPPSEGRPRRP